MSKLSWNHVHPELQDGEVFYTNVAINTAMFYESLHTPPKDFLDLTLKTKRIGMQAYDVVGGLLAGYRPVFVQRQELVDAGLNPPYGDCVSCDTAWPEARVIIS